jgi:hypothetical protein
LIWIKPPPRKRGFDAAGMSETAAPVTAYVTTTRCRTKGSEQ